MSNLDQLADSARRKAEQAERTAARHQERVDLWEEHVRNRPRGSAARRRAERELRRNRRRRDRALERAGRQREREAGYRRRALRQPPAPPQPPRRTWVPRTPLGKSLAYGLIAAGVVTGVAIGGPDGFNPFDDDSAAAVSFADGVANQAQQAAGADAADDAEEVVDEAERTADDVMNDAQNATDEVTDADDSIDEIIEDAEEAAEQVVDEVENVTDDAGDSIDGVAEQAEQTAEYVVEETQDAADDVIGGTGADRGDDGQDSTHVDDGGSDPTDSAGQAGSTEATTVYDNTYDEEYELALHECFDLLDLYPELEVIEPAAASWCVEDPFTTLPGLYSITKEIDAEYFATVDQCWSLLAAYPDLEPTFGEGCYQDPWTTIGAITDEVDRIDAENAAIAEFDRAVEECMHYLGLYPEIETAFPGTIEWCHSDPYGSLPVILDTIAEIDAAILAEIEAAEAAADAAAAEAEAQAVEDAASEEYAATVDICYSALEEYPHLLEVDPSLGDRCHTDAFDTLAEIDQLLSVND